MKVGKGQKQAAVIWMNWKCNGHRDGHWQEEQACEEGKQGQKQSSTEGRGMDTHFLQKVQIFLPGGLFEKVVRQELEQKS